MEQRVRDVTDVFGRDSTATRAPSDAGGAFSIALVHDYLTQRGGAERVVLSMLRAFPHASLHTSVFNPATTFPDFAAHEVHRSALDRVGVLRTHHRLGLPLYAGAFDRMTLDVDVMLCSSSGWAHGASTTGRKVVYCYAPARWLYQTDRYLGGSSPMRAPLRVLAPLLRRWDQRAAGTADRYLTSSTVVRDRLWSIYGIDAEIVPPPHAMSPTEAVQPVPGVDAGFFLCVARLLPYKNVDVVIEAFRLRPSQRLVVVGDGPERARLAGMLPANVTMLGSVSDAQLRWLYRASRGVVAASHEDFGLTPLEGAAVGRPSAVLRAGGFLDTVVESETGIFFDALTPDAIAAAIDRLDATSWSEAALAAHADGYGEAAFHERLRDIMAMELGS